MRFLRLGLGGLLLAAATGGALVLPSLLADGPLPRTDALVAPPAVERTVVQASPIGGVAQAARAELTRPERPHAAQSEPATSPAAAVVVVARHLAPRPKPAPKPVVAPKPAKPKRAASSEPVPGRVLAAKEEKAKPSRGRLDREEAARADDKPEKPEKAEKRDKERPAVETDPPVEPSRQHHGKGGKRGK